MQRRSPASPPPPSVCPGSKKRVLRCGTGFRTSTGRRAALEAALEAERKSHEARVAELTRMGAELEKKFAGLASDVLGKNSESFLKLVSERFEKHSASAKDDLEKRRVAIETLVKPLGESLTKFEHKVDDDREGARPAPTGTRSRSR